MKKLLSLVYVLLLVFVLTGCNGISDEGKALSEDRENKITESNEESVDDSISFTVSGDSLTVFYEKPEEWEELFIYYYDVKPNLTVSWDDAPEMTKSLEHDGWYYYEFPSGTTSAVVMFKDGDGNQVPASGEPGVEVTESTMFYSDYVTFETVTISASGLPMIKVNPMSKSFEGSLDVAVEITSSDELTKMAYIINGTEYSLHSNSEEITIGDDIEALEEISLIIKAENEHGTVETEPYIYKKREPLAEENLVKNEKFNELRIYQIVVGAYMDTDGEGYGIGYGPSDHNGDINGVIESLDYIESLNVNAIWLTPIFESKSNDSYDEYQVRGRTTGYFADDYFNVDPNFGTNEEFKTLVDEAHKRGMYIFLDGVFGHHGSYDIDGVVNGNSQWYGYEVEYPESLDFYKNVATYWIEEYNIDGWRMDQAYQLYQDEENYWREIRYAIENVCSKRAERGEEWGTLGYIVGEIWDISGEDINIKGHSRYGLRSFFDFPLRYAVVRSLVADEHGNTAPLDSINEAFDIQYADYAQQNLFISNHDLARIGDIIEMAGLEGEYWQRHKLVISFLASYTGPITLYYGDEYGDQYDLLKTHISELDSEKYVAVDNVARSNGKTDNFSDEQLDLIAYTSKVMRIREENKALSNGDRKNLLTEENVYVDLKSFESNEVVYLLNRGPDNEVIQLSSEDIDGDRLINLITGEVIASENGQFEIHLSPVSSGFFEVLK